MQCFRSAPRKCIFWGSAPRAAAATAVAALKLEWAQLRADLTPGFGPLKLIRADIVGTATVHATNRQP